uniref:Putative secreted protein n=1 Tax=Ixodes ricinus TaxID=34613 RepID=A0A6B0U3V1_IXORI
MLGGPLPLAAAVHTAAASAGDTVGSGSSPPGRRNLQEVPPTTGNGLQPEPAGDTAAAGGSGPLQRKVLSPCGASRGPG